MTQMQVISSPTVCISESEKIKRPRCQWIFPWHPKGQKMMTHWWHTEMLTKTKTHTVPQAGTHAHAHTVTNTHSPGLRFPLEQALSPPLRVGAEMVGQLTTNLLHCPKRVALLLDTHRQKHTNYQFNYRGQSGDEKNLLVAILQRFSSTLSVVRTAGHTSETFRQDKLDMIHFCVGLKSDFLLLAYICLMSFWAC